MAKMWERIVEATGKHKMSSAFHPETDGQSEVYNQTLERILRSYTNYAQDNWYSLLPMAEIAYNNSIQASTKLTPFMANYGFNPKFDLELHRRKGPEVPTAEEMLTKMKDIQDFVTEELKHAIEEQKKYADKKRIKFPELKEGDKVWILTRNIKTTRPAKKLDYKKIGPYTVERKISNVAYKIKLPDSMRIHPVFHVSLLEPYKESRIEGRVQPPPPPIVLEDEEQFYIKDILDVRIRGRGRNKHLEYLIDWEGYGIEERTWTKEEDIDNGQELIEDFYRGNLP